MPRYADFKPELLQRFLRYVRIDTQSDPQSATFPSTPKQLDLLRLLADELRSIGVRDVRQDEHGYVMATLPSTVRAADRADGAIPTIGFLAHVDTSPDVSGASVNPQLIERYRGGPIVLPRAADQVIDPSEFPELARAEGHTLVTTDGTTLLGADDKAGIAEIMTAIAYLQAHPELEHGPIAVAFTPDEEIGRGTERFSVEQFGAHYAYTLDGSNAGSIEQETFSGDSGEVVIEGQNHHPGYAKGKMVNAIKLAAELVCQLPRGRLSPETTEHREGYVHPTTIQGTVERAVVQFILRDFDDAELREHRRLIERLAADVSRLDARAVVRVTFAESYRNMRGKLGEVPHVVAYAEEAMRRVGIEPYLEPIRGGTDGAKLTAMGLPTPNLFTGAHNYHSRREFADVDEMVLAVETIIELARVWAEKSAPSQGVQ